MMTKIQKLSTAIILISALCIFNEVKTTTIKIDTPYPPRWHSAPSSIDEYPLKVIHGKKSHVIDPWNYEQRLGVFKIMIITTESYFEPWGFNNTGNLLWGLPLQFGWQMSSKRLQVRAHSTSKVSDYSLEFTPASWWANMNYYLSIIPFLGAVEARVVPHSKYPFYILFPQNVTTEMRDRFCTSVTQCQSRYPSLMDKWSTFFHHLRTRGYENFGQDMDTTVGLLWDAHVSSIATAKPMFTDNLHLLSVPEMHFGRGWALLVDFIAATHFQTNMNNTYQQQAIALPPRILHSGDYPPHIPHFTKYQNNALQIINLIYNAETLTDGGFLYLWKKAMCSDKERADGRDMLENLLEHPIVVVEDLIKLVIDFIKTHGC